MYPVLWVDVYTSAQFGVVSVDIVLVVFSVDVVRRYRESALSIQEVELSKALKAVERGESPEQVLQRLARDLTNKLIHAPTTGLRQLAREGDSSQVTRAKALLGLDEDLGQGPDKPTLQ